MASLLLKPGLRLLISREVAASEVTWFASVAIVGYSAAKDGFESGSAAFLWAADSVARFEASVVS